MNRASVFPILTCLGCFSLFVLDQGTKAYFFEQAHPFVFLRGFIQSVEHYNYGIAFNLPIPQFLILAITVFASLGMVIASFYAWRKHLPLLSIALGVLLGGTLGNGYDRLTLGFVRDWVLLGERSAINFADLAIFAGLIGVLFITQRKKLSPLDN